MLMLLSPAKTQDFTSEIHGAAIDATGDVETW